MPNDAVAQLATIAPGLVDRLGSVRGVVGVVLGGSRARGQATPGSDYDVGIYYSGSLDVAALQGIAADLSTEPTQMTRPGGWGPWVDGGGWLTVDDRAIDIIYRDVGRVRDVWTECQIGRYSNHVQAGHPLGFWSHSYAGELALAILLDDPTGRLSSLRTEMSDYPPALAAALVAGTWEADFSIANARKAIARLDVAYVAGCLFRAIGVLAHAIHGHDHRWLLNEKGAVAATGGLPSAPPDFERRAVEAFGRLRATSAELTAACDQVQALIEDARHRFD